MTADQLKECREAFEKSEWVLFETQGPDLTREDDGYLQERVNDDWIVWQAAWSARLPNTQPMVSGETSDGYHTFDELYAFRMMYNAALFNEWYASGKYSVHKSKRHNSGEECFGGGWFIVVANLPDGQITNHYKLEYWDLFRVQEAEKALFEYDGHTPKDTLDRLANLPAPQAPQIEKVLKVLNRGRRALKRSSLGSGVAEGIKQIDEALEIIATLKAAQE